VLVFPDLRSGNLALHLLQNAGAAVVRLGDGSSSGLSRDRARALAVVPAMLPKLMLYPTGAGVHRQLAPGAFKSILSAEWFSDSAKILVCGTAADHVRTADPSWSGHSRACRFASIG
jgi:hypothetical protein